MSIRRWGICPNCLEAFPIRRDGMLRKHAYRPSSYAHRVLGYEGPCPGGGHEPREVVRP